MNNAILREAHEQSAAEHTRLQAGAEALLAAWPHDARKAAELRPCLVQVLTELRARLKAHFAEEESPEYMSEAVTAAPRLTTRANELLQQHSQLLATLDRVIADVDNQGLTGDQLVNEREVLRTLIHNLRRHEQDEDELLLEAFDDDIGTGD